MRLEDEPAYASFEGRGLNSIWRATGHTGDRKSDGFLECELRYCCYNLNGCNVHLRPCSVRSLNLVRCLDPRIRAWWVRAIPLVGPRVDLFDD